MTRDHHLSRTAAACANVLIADGYQRLAAATVAQALEDAKGRDIEAALARRWLLEGEGLGWLTLLHPRGDAGECREMVMGAVACR